MRCLPCGGGKVMPAEEAVPPVLVVRAPALRRKKRKSIVPTNPLSAATKPPRRETQERDVREEGRGEGRMGSRPRRPQSITRVITVDTSRAKSNAEVVRACIDKFGWKDYPEGRADGRPCDIYWYNLVYPDMKDKVLSGSKVNRFPGMNELTRKIHLSRALRRMQVLYPSQFDFCPRSWFIPAQLEQFYEDYYALLEQRKTQVPWFIVKPDEGAQGCGIYLIHSPEQLQNLDQPQLIQEYLAEPYLLQDNLKFDLRVYAVIKSINPLSIYVAREGMARFCTQRYRLPSSSNSDQVYMHLTNFSLNKASEILGFDILLTKDLEPVLLEINACPSLTMSQEIPSDDKENSEVERRRSVVDEAIKFPLVRDTLLLVTDQLRPRTTSASSLRSLHAADDTEPAYHGRPSLREVFPARYSHSCGHLLILDRAAYLYMQFISVRRTLLMTLTGFRSFVRKCHLGTVMKDTEVEEMYERVAANFTGLSSPGQMPFHGFVEMLTELAKRKYAEEEEGQPLGAHLHSLLNFCQIQLRHAGVRSASLRNQTVEAEDSECGGKQIFLLPNRIPGSRRPKARKDRLPNSVSLPRIT